MFIYVPILLNQKSKFSTFYENQKARCFKSFPSKKLLRQLFVDPYAKEIFLIALALASGWNIGVPIPKLFIRKIIRDYLAELALVELLLPINSNKLVSMAIKEVYRTVFLRISRSIEFELDLCICNLKPFSRGTIAAL